MKIAAEVARTEPDIRLLLVGNGPLREEIARAVSRTGLGDKAILTGATSDIPRLMRAMDIFVLPSSYEGLGMVLVEAQATGLPCLISDTIPADGEIVKPLMHRLSLERPAAEWARKILDIRSGPSPPSRESYLEMVAASPFNIINSMKNLERIYEEESRNLAGSIR